jgi:hypothetical protein
MITEIILGCLILVCTHGVSYFYGQLSVRNQYLKLLKKDKP